MIKNKKINVIKNTDVAKIDEISVENKKANKLDCKIRVMPPQISDADINALFSGLVSIVRRKIELETRAEIINANLDCNRLNNALKSKQAECTRLKNEILHLKLELENAKNNKI